MKIDYYDIVSRIPTPPLWYDVNGCPRYDSFSPQMFSVYARELILSSHRCQMCGTRFLAGWEFNPLDTGKALSDARTLAEFREFYGNLEYGDPPGYCCDEGRACSSEFIRIEEAWRLNESREWEQIDA